MTEASDADHVLGSVHAGDQHVAATAITARADTIVTINTRHFPQRSLTPHGIRVISPGTLIGDLDNTEPAIIDLALNQLASRWENPPRTVTEIVDLLAAHPAVGRPMNTIRKRVR